MSNVKKHVSRLLIFCMILVCFAGCKQKDKETAGDETKATNEPSSSAKQDDPEPTKEAEPPVELDIHFHSNNKYTIEGEDGKILPVFQLAADETNVIVHNVANPVAQNSNDEFQLQASEQFPADIYGGTSLRSAIMNYAYQGAFLPMNDLIDQYAPNIKKFLEENPEVKRSLTAADGNIYMLNYMPDGDVGRVFFIRQDWLDKLNLKMPTTFDELEEVLYAFRNNDPNGNGIKDEVPLFNDKWQELVRSVNLWGARCFGFDTFEERVVFDENDHFYHAWTADKFKEALIGLNKWYKDGIIDQEAFTRKTNTARSTLWTKENVGGMTHDFFASTSNFNHNEELLASTPDFNLVGMLPVHKDGSAWEEHHRAVAKPDGWAISANCKNPEAAIRYMDWFFSEKGHIAYNFGIEGDSYTMKDGKAIFTDKVLSQSNVFTFIQKTYGAQLPIGYKQTFDYEAQWVSKEGMDAFNLYKNKGEDFYLKRTPIFNLTQEETEEYEAYLSAVNSYQDEMVVAFITGKTDIESNWDAYVERCNELGAQKIVDIYNVAYERYLNIK